MADVTITSLAELATTAGEDLLAIVDDPGGSPVTKKVTLTNLLPASIAGDGLTGGGGSALSVNVDDSTIELSGDAVQVKDDGITPAKLESLTIYLSILPPDGSLTIADGVFYFCIPNALDGLDLISAHAAVVTAPTAGTPTVQLYSTYHSNDILSTKITIDVGEYNSWSASVPPVINTSRDDLHVGSYIRIDIDDTGTSTKGLMVILEAS